MRALLLASAMLTVIGGQAFAADAVGLESAAHDWSGVYVGGHLGYGFGSTDATYNVPNTPAIRGTQDYDIDGFLGGVQIGYDYQVNSAVLGIEADISGADIKGHSDEVNVGGGDVYDTKVDWFGSISARAGYAFGSTLVYGTGGLAIGGVENRYLDGPADSYSEKNTKIGWTIGAGLEQAITDHWSANAEYRYVDLRDQTINYAPNSNTTFDNTFSTVRIGMNYKF
ncbi:MULTISPECIES: outer membrane protein [unclassified Mesorhizobium]|uniref:outer membrane protein n=1 Tax=unclassified Mesorhizobium TaxID=325217 RepID=UPI001CCB878B|nr:MULTISPECIES: outer membrane protein [unclassified Mesorhizobium]MBZ9681280.1 porin family protein [Mesorhizobium sp. CO1-1-2]MBZ9927874.1 porin family protein [Mesorhizobium sp. BR1-1-4]